MTVSFDAFVQFVQQLGFPIVCCAALFYQNQRQHDQFKETIDELRSVILDNNNILQDFINKHYEKE